MKRIIFALSLLSASSVLAQTSVNPVPAERTTVITIGEEVIEGDLKMPAGFVAAARAPKSTHRTLVKPRIDFRRELLSSVSSL